MVKGKIRGKEREKKVKNRQTCNLFHRFWLFYNLGGGNIIAPEADVSRLYKNVIYSFKVTGSQVAA